jgi:hypothetical protein
MARKPFDALRSDFLKKMPSVEQMSTSLVVHSVQDARKVRKAPPEIPGDQPVYYLPSWKIKKFHLFLDCGGGRAIQNEAVKWQAFATHTIPRRLVPDGITICLSCVHVNNGLHAPAPAVTFASDEDALKWLATASKAFSNRGTTAAAPATGTSSALDHGSSSPGEVRGREAGAVNDDHGEEGVDTGTGQPPSQRGDLTPEQRAEERRRKAALRMAKLRAAETEEHKQERLRKAKEHMRAVRETN